MAIVVYMFTFRATECERLTGLLAKSKLHMQKVNNHVRF